MKFLSLLPILFTLQSYAQSEYTKAWQSLNANSKTEAKQLLEKALQDPAVYADAYLTKLYLDTYMGKEMQITDFSKNFVQKSSDPYPYIYALWYNNAVLGNYSKKSSHQLELAGLLLKDDKAPGTLAASANYQLGMHELFSNRFDKRQSFYNAIGSIRNWQYTGPFENLSESGFDKNYGPLQHPEPTAAFKSSTNADIKWITPSFENPDGWIPTSYVINKQTAVTYAQNFVYSPADQNIYCSIGFSGNIKVWINDELLISESHERTTDFDAYSTLCKLKKGTNRVLIQLGYTNEAYPNFSLRFTDERYRVIPGITGSSTYAEYPKSAENASHAILPHFAEKYFEDKIAGTPGNLINYLLLTDTYLRSKKLMEARHVINEALKMAPDNPLVHFENILVLIKEDNRTLLSEEIQKVKNADPESLFILDYQIKEAYENKKYAETEALLEKRISLYGEDESSYGYKIGILSNDKKYEEMIKLAEKMYARYPENVNLLYMMYNIKKEVYKDNKAALGIYENFFKNNYNNQAWKQYEGILSEMGKNEKTLSMKESIGKNFPFSPESYSDLAAYYYSAKQYNKAEEYINKAISLSNYHETYWSSLGDILSEEKNIPAAVAAFQRSLEYEPNQYDIINKIRKLSGKSELNALLTSVDADQVIKADKIDNAKNTDYGYYYILDQKDVILTPGGAREEYLNNIIRITNQKGVDEFKESSIGYDNSQELLIDRAEVIKKNGAKVEGEKYGNQVVFTNLEAGDVIYFKYRLRNFVSGRFANEFTDKYYFSGQIYTAIARYNLWAPADKTINYIFSNTDTKPVIKDVENFKKYSWEIQNAEPDKDEPLMPKLVDVSSVLNISTIQTWKDISGWYADVINNRIEEDHYVKDVYTAIFPDGNNKMNQFQTAKKIYDYIEKNIRYSSVSFRQSGYIPQKASQTLTTRLGDCKDLSNLFVTLSNLAGIKSQMVLVDTRDNGARDIVLPSMDFNHCIVKANLDNKYYYLELTDSELPFASVPNNLMGALILEIPSKSGMPGSDLSSMTPATRTKDIIRRTIDIKTEGTDQLIDVKFVKTGSLSSGFRSSYKDLDETNRLKEMEETIANMYSNPIKLHKLSFKGLASAEDSVSCDLSYKVTNEIAEIGTMRTFKIRYHDVVASLDKFSSDTRTYPIEYWNYEDADAYETTVNITAPTGRRFVEIPQSETYSFKNLNYSLKFVLKAPDRLIVTRKFTNDRPQQISPSDYKEFKSFFEKIVKQEQKFIAYK